MSMPELNRPDVLEAQARELTVYLGLQVARRVLAGFDPRERNELLALLRRAFTPR